MDISTILMFDSCDKKSCINISIVDDDVIENTESFSVLLAETPGLIIRIMLDPVEAEIEIIDNDSEFSWTAQYVLVIPMPFYLSGCGRSGGDILQCL